MHTWVESAVNPLPVPADALAAVRHILDVLNPYSEDNGGPLHIEHVSYVEGRGNIIGAA